MDLPDASTVGSIVKIIRSGDVIPHIKSVTIPAQQSKMPSVPYHWTESHIDIVLDNIEEDENVREKNNTYFMTNLEIEGLSAGNMKRIMKTGNDTIPKILKMTKDDLEKVEGFKSKMADKIYNSIQEKLNNASLPDIMIASNLFGRGLGKKKIVLIMEAYPNILLDSQNDVEKINLLKKIGGIGEENAKGFISNISPFLLFLKECGLEYKLSKSELKNSDKKSDIVEIEETKHHPLHGKKIVMTKIRDMEIINKLKSVGGILDDNIGKNTFALIVKSKNDVSNKTKYAIEHNIPIFESNEFKIAFLN
jgi:NAD-dependent DNA ligase